MMVTGKVNTVMNIAVIDTGLVELCAATSSHRAAHNVTIYERYDLTGKIGAFLSAACNEDPCTGTVMLQL